MNLPQTVSEVLREHVTLECECIDRMYLNVYVPQLQSVGGVVGYLHAHHGQRFASTAAVAPMSETFVTEVERFAEAQGVEVVPFRKGQRKDEVTQRRIWPSLRAPKRCCISARRKSGHGWCAPSAGTMPAPGPLSPGSWPPRRWLITSTSTAWTKTSAPSS